MKKLSNTGGRVEKKCCLQKRRISKLIDILMALKIFVSELYKMLIYLPYIKFYSKHCVESVQLWSFFWSVLSRTQIKYRKIQTRKNSIFVYFSRSENITKIYQ